MLLDTLFLGMMITAVIKGFRNGLIVAVFSLVGWIIGLFAAVRFSDKAASYIQDTIAVSPRWLSVISFTAVFIAVMLLIRLGAGIIQKTMELTMMGWLNRLGGIFFYVLLYTFIFGVMIFFAGKVKMISEETISSSVACRSIKPIVQITGLSF